MKITQTAKIEGGLSSGTGMETLQKLSNTSLLFMVISVTLSNTGRHCTNISVCSVLRYEPEKDLDPGHQCRNSVPQVEQKRH